MWIFFICVRSNWHILNAHINRSSILPAIKYDSSASGIWPTSPCNLHTTQLLSVLDMTFTGTSLPGYYPMKNTPKSDCGPTRRSGELSLEELDKRLSLGKDEDLVCFYAAGFSLIYAVLITWLKYPRNIKQVKAWITVYEFPWNGTVG